MILRALSKIGNYLPKVTLHPLFLSYLAVLFFCGNERGALLSLGVVLLHECAHFAVAKKVGITLSDVVLYPFGAVMVDEEGCSRDSWKVAIAGPAVNLLLAVVGALVLFLHKSVLVAEFINANLTVGLFNLLPVYPLDGGRIMIALSKKPVRTTRALRISGVVISVLLFLSFALSLFGKVNFSLGIMSVFLLLGAVTGYEREMSARIAKILLSRQKDYAKGLPVVKLACSAKMKTHKVLSRLSPYRVTEIEVVYPNGRVKEVSEGDFLIFASTAEPDTPIGELC